MMKGIYTGQILATGGLGMYNNYRRNDTILGVKIRPATLWSVMQ